MDPKHTNKKVVDTLTKKVLEDPTRVNVEECLELAYMSGLTDAYAQTSHLMGKLQDWLHGA